MYEIIICSFTVIIHQIIRRRSLWLISLPLMVAMTWRCVVIINLVRFWIGHKAEFLGQRTWQLFLESF